MRRGHSEVSRVLERTILDQFGVDTSVTRVIDILQPSASCHCGSIATAYLVKEAIAIWNAEFASDIATRRLNDDIERES